MNAMPAVACTAVGELGVEGSGFSVISGTNGEHYTIRVLKTEQGYLHDDISEGVYLDDGEVNYAFTDDPFQAHQFPSYMEGEYVPKYLDVTVENGLETEEDCCQFLNGKIVEVEIEIRKTWKEKG